MSNRRLVIVDVESTGLDPAVHVPIEVAAIDVDTGEVISFAPYVDPTKWADASGEALAINRYFERRVFRQALTYDATVQQYDRLWDMLAGNSFAGANPRFDVSMLLTAPGAPGSELWHHRLPDVSAYVAGALGIYPADLPGLADCCKLLDVTNEGEHSALGDVKAAAECFRRAAKKSSTGATDPDRGKPWAVYQ